MGTKAKLSTKMLSFFLSVLMAVSCFGIVLPGLAPEAQAATASESQWQTLKDALVAAQNGGYLGTDLYTVSVDANGNAVIDDTSKNGYLYAIVRAVGEIAVAEGAEAGHNHNALLDDYIVGKLESDYEMTLTTYQKEFIEKILPSTAEFYTSYTPDAVWIGDAADVSLLPESISLSTVVKRDVKGALLTDYANAADVPAAVDTTYKISFSAARKTQESGETIEGRDTKLWYENASVVSTTETTAAPDLSAIVEYVNYVTTDAGFVNGYAAWKENPDSLYFEDADVLEARYNAYKALQDGVNACDVDYIEHFVSVSTLNEYFTYAKAALSASRVVLTKHYVDWINGLPLGDGSLNKLDYTENDRMKMEALRDQAKDFRTAVNALDADTMAILTEKYGYNQSYQLTADAAPMSDKTYYKLVQTAVVNADNTQTVQDAYEAVPVESITANANDTDTSKLYIGTLYELVSYDNYILDLDNKIERYNLADIRSAAQALMHNDASHVFTFPAGSRFSSYSLTSDTEPVEGKTYYVKDAHGLYAAASEVTEENIASLYEAVGTELLCVGNKSYDSEAFVTNGEECPVTYLDLISLESWFRTAVNYIANAKTENIAVTLKSEEINEINAMATNLTTELYYREADDTNETWRTEYAYFVNLMLNYDIPMLSNETLIGYVDAEENPVDGLIYSAIGHKGRLEGAFYSLNFNGNERVRQQYQDFLNKAEEIINKMAKVALDRSYSELISIYKNAKQINGSANVPYGSTTSGYAITTANFSLVKAGISNLDDDRDTDGVQNALYTWLIANRTLEDRIPVNIEARVNAVDGSGTGKYTDITNIFGWLWSADENADTYAKAAEACVAADWNSFARFYNDHIRYNNRTYTPQGPDDLGSSLGTSGTAASGFNNTGIYTVRDGRADDMVRADNDKDYVVTNDKITKVIEKLDTFATSEQLVKLIGQYDEDKDIRSLKDFINNLLVENLFSDEMVNTIVSMLFPMLSDLIENKLIELLMNSVEGAGAPKTGGSMSLNLQTLMSSLIANGTVNAEMGQDESGWAGTLKYNVYLNTLKGDIEISLNGKKGTKPFVEVFKELGVNIFPSTLADYLDGTANSAQYSGFITALEDCNDNWMAFDRNGDETIDKDDFALAGFNWGVHDYSSFISVMSDFIGAAGPLINTLFTNHQFDSGTVSKLVRVEAYETSVRVSGEAKLFGVIGPGIDRTVSINGFDSYGDGSIKIDGMLGYSDLWAPILEALGLSGITDSYSVTDSTPFSSTIGTSGVNATTEQLVNSMFRPLLVLIDQVSNKPIATVLGLLPNLSYNIAHDNIKVLLNTLKTTLHVSASVDIQDFGDAKIEEFWFGYWDLSLGWLADLLKTPITNLINGFLNFDPEIDIGGMLDLKKLLPFDITNLNDIVKYIFDEMAGDDVSELQMANIPPINAGRIGGLGDKENRASVRSANLDGGVCHYVNADTPDVLYELIQLVVGFVAQSGNLSGLLTRFSGSGLGSDIESILGAVDTEASLAALVELFLPQEYKMTPYDWYHPNTAASTFNFGTEFSQANFAYLTYQNDWSREKAQYMFDNLEKAVDDVMNMIDGDMLDGYEGFSDWLLHTVNKMFANRGITGVVNILLNLAGKLDNESRMVANLLKDQISADGAGEVDIFSWYNKFGYLYPEYRVLGTHEVTETDDEGNVTTTTVNEVVYSKQDGYGNTIYCVGYPEEKTQKIDGVERTLTVMNFVRTYPLAPAGFKGFTQLADGGYALTTEEGGAGAYDAVKVTYKYQAVQATTSTKTYDNYVPANDAADTNYSSVVGNNFTNIAPVVLSEADEDGNQVQWKVTGNANTAQFGVASGQTYTLVDGEMGNEESAVNPNVSARAIFAAIFASLVEPLAPLFSFLLNGRDLKFFDEALIIKGYDVYNGALVPLLEVAGVKGLLTSQEFKTQYGNNSVGGLYYLINKTFVALTDLLTPNADGTPVQKVIGLLPRLFYFLQSDGLGTLLNNILMPIWVLVDDIRPIVDVNLDVIIHDIAGALLGVDLREEGSDTQNAISSLLMSFIDLEPILDRELADTERIVSAIENVSIKKLRLKAIANLAAEFTGMDLMPLFYAFEGMCNGYTLESGAQYGVVTYTSSHYDIGIFNTNGTRDYSKTYTLEYAGPDTVTVTICTVLDLLRYKDNAKALDELIGLTRELLPGEEFSDEITAAGLLEALEVVFQDRGSLEYQHPNWDYLIEGKAVKDKNGDTVVWTATTDWRTLWQFNDLSHLELHNKHDEVTKRALAYKTDWTRETAVSMDVMFSTVLDYVTTAFLAKDNAEITSFEDFVNDLIDNKLLSAGLLKTIGGYIALLYNFLPASVVGIVDNLLKTNLSAWMAGVDDNDPTTGYIRKGDSDNVVLDNDGKPVQKKDDEGNPVFESDGVTPVYEYEDPKTYYVNESFGWWATDEQVQLGEDNQPILDDEGHPVTIQVPAGSAYVDTRDEFFDAITELLTPVSAILGFIFLEDSYKLFYTAGDNLSDENGNVGSATGDDTDAIILNGAGAWNKGMIPLFEALGLEAILNGKDSNGNVNTGSARLDTLNNYAASKYLVEDDNGDPIPGKYDDERFTADFIKLLRKFAEGVIADPVNWLLDNLANIIYFINASGVSTAVKNIFDSVQSVIDMINTRLSASDRISASNLAGINLSNLTLSGIFKLIENFTGWTDDDGVKHTGLHVRDELVEYIRGLYIGELTHYISANGHDAFRMDCYETLHNPDDPDYDPSREDRANLITVFLALVLEIAEDSGRFVDPTNNYEYSDYDNPAVIDHLAGTDGLVTDIIHAIRNPADLTYKEINWNYFDKTVDLAAVNEEGKVLNVEGYLFQYLNYTTQWTYTKAARTADGLENMVISILGFVDKDKFGEMESLGELINIEQFYSGKYLQMLLDLLDKYLYGEDAVLDQSLLNVIGCVLGADLTKWNRQYAFGSEADFEGKTLQTDETGMEWAALPVMEAQTDGEGNAVLDDEGNPVMVDTGRTIKTYLIKDRASFLAGATLLLEPAYRLLDWLLFGDSYEFFNGNTAATENDVLINVQGSKGYAEGLVLLLEALGCTNLKYASYYVSENGDVDTAAYMNDILTSLCDRVEEICADPVNQVVGLIPELIYFINAGGLQTVVANLLAGPLGLVNALNSLTDDADDGEEITDEEVSVVDSLISDALNNGLKDMLNGRTIDFRMDNINLQFIFEIAEAVTGLEITDVVGNKLDLFRMGDIYRYRSMGGDSGRDAYKMQFSDEEDFADFITILLSFVLDTLLYEDEANGIDNAAALGELIGKDNEQMKAIIAAVVSFLREGFTVDEVKDIDWLYFDPNYSLYNDDGTEKETPPSYDENTAVELPPRTINYLTYASDWTDELAHYIYNNRDQLINSVLKLANLDETEVLGIKLKDIFNNGAAADLLGNIYTGKNLNAILSGIQGLTEKVPDALFDLLNIILDIDLSAYKTMPLYDEETPMSRTEFIDGLVTIVSPLGTILDWLLFGENKGLQYFDKIYYDEEGNVVTDEEGAVVVDVLLNINGANGYDYGLIPILEVLGINPPKSNAGSTTSTMLKPMLNSLIDRVEEILSNPVDELLDLIPNLLYFINSKGLITSITNLLAAPMAMLDKVNDTLDPDGTQPEKRVGINTLLDALDLGITSDVDIMNLDLKTIFLLLQDILGVQVLLDEAEGYHGFVETSKIETFYFGNIELSLSANGKVRGKMVYTEEEDRADMLTILVNFVLELALHTWTDEDGVTHSNAEALENFLKLDPGTISGIIDAIHTLGAQAAPGDYHWDYFNHTEDNYTFEENELGFFTRTANNQFENYLTYADGQLWKRETAVNLYENLGTLIDNIISMTADDDGAQTLGEILKGSFDLYTADNLNAILDLIQKAYDAIGEEFINLFGLVLGADLTSWNGLRFEEGSVIDKDTFRTGLIEILKPLYPVLDWLLFGRDYAFFVSDKDGNLVNNERGENELLKIAGSQGYAYALVPVLKVLGVKNLPTCTVGTTKCGTEVEGKTFFEYILNSLLDRVDEILTNPVDEIFAILPQLLYFINANGLATVVENLLGAVLNAGNELVARGVLKLEGGETIGDYIESLAGINIGNLDLEGIFAFVETLDVVHGLKLNEVFTRDFDNDGVAENILEYFYVGAGAERYTDNEDGSKFVLNKDGTPYALYRLRIADNQKGDIITLLFSIVLEVLFYQGNEDAFTAIINGFLDQDPDDGEDAFTKEAFITIKALLADGADPVAMQTMDWVYFNNYESDEARQEAIMAVLTAQANALPALPERTVNYLKYDMNNNPQMKNLWTEDVVSYVDANLNNIVDKVIGLVTGGEFEDLNAFISSMLNLFSQETADMIVNALVGALDSLDEAVLNTAGSLLGIDDLGSLKTAKAENVTDKESFVNELSRILSPAEPLLKWLLFGGDFRFFTKLETGEPAILSIKGGKGYKYGLAPILNALGIETAISEDNILHDLLLNVADRVEEILANPIDEILNLLPELIYFVNANGLGTAVMNLLNPVDSLLKAAGEAMQKELSINSLITAIDLEHLDFNTIFALLKDAVGITLSDDAGEPIGKYLSTFYFGELEYVTIYDDPDPAEPDLNGFRMVYTDRDARYDMVTILVALVLDVVTYTGNKDAIVDLLKNVNEENAEGIYNAIMAFLTHNEVQVQMVPYRWILTEYATDSTDAAKAGRVLTPNNMEGGHSYFGDQMYGPLYTRPMGEYITKHFPLFVNTWITLLGIENGKGGTYRNLEDLLDSLIGESIYKTSMLETIADALSGAIESLKETLGEDLFSYIVGVLEKSLKVDISKLEDYAVKPIRDGDRKAFVSEIANMVSAVAPILRWLLTGQSISLFTDRNGDDYIVIEGARAYKDSIIPILEALHVPSASILTQEEYEAATADDDAAMLECILNPLLDRVDEILADPLNEIFDVLPGLAYFINSKGLDSAFRNVLNAVYKVLETIDPLVADVEKLHKIDANGNKVVSLYPLLGDDFDLEVFDFSAIADLLVGLVNNTIEGTGLELTGILDNAIYELTLGVVTPFQSKRGEKDYTMHYAGTTAGGSTGVGDKVDLATVVMRIVLNFLANPHNVQALEEMLNGKLNENGYKFVCALLENFQQMLATPGGIDKVMYTVYYIFFVALNTGVATNNGLANFNYNYSFMNRMFAESDVGFFRALERSLGGLLDKHTPDVVTHDEVAPNGLIKFFQAIIDFFKKIGNFFKNLFSR